LNAHLLRRQVKTSGKWFPYNKGGEYRKWYGNKFFVINWECDGKEVKKYAVDRNKGKHWSRYIQNLDWMFQEGVTWSATSSSYFGCRYTERGFLFDVKGTSAFSNKINPYVMIGFLTTKLVSYILNFLNPTIEFQTRDIRNLPFVAEVNENKDLLNICRSSIEVEKKDWNAYETSWDFTVLPLLHIEYHQPTLNTTYQNLRTRWRETTLEMQQLEEENNRIFIEAYGLQEEMTPEVPLKEITLTCNPYYRYGGDKSEEELEALLLTDTMKEFISYAVGCMFGRYSLDKPGLVLANQGETVADYLAKIPEPTFKPNENNVIPLLDGDWFPDDIVDQFCRFLRITFGEAQYQENLDFIETAIAKDIRNYFLKGFYDDHLKRYKKRPIYWLFSSGKQRAFQCLVYLHRYNEGTLARMRTEYVIPLLGRMASRLEQLGNDLTKPTSSAHGKKLEKERGSLLKQQRELQEFDEKLRHFADKRICLDLDDGVKVNYGKFGDLLAEVKAVTGDKVE
jgi:type II restriction/modification system DNA methylase subunit YeeA